ncbi:type III secretion system cytoplasmic ring protein SctQ [Pseudomonas sp. 6D_7.1_Bac1]|uniref:type III secretion system cytoplasmic ring protein SctQ n=1 Tax=Pseudomonas sp. 6D_7.1_Bac1 TaxID=2971615 RepID=UPI0021C7210A|nr:type III secretion system cytoplasmic ring protein SctQ [Pseudomonas sp. 6D_7.1_Bac1]MCU1748797.1 type III secretion system cytoplasmic ring protein SctQ [Pseudomonas sp. 6D_7.1_Bac1]
MQLPSLSESAGQLLRKIGAGRRLEQVDGTLTMTYSMAGGDGLILSAEVLGQPVRLWLMPDHWCRWISPVLSVPAWPAVPVELHSLLAAWTLASAGAVLCDSNMAWPIGATIEPGHVETTPYWCLRIEREGCRLDAWILDAPLVWLDTLAEAFTPLQTTEETGVRRIPVPLVAGWSRIDEQALKRLSPGDGLLLQHGYLIADGELGLFMNRPLATLAGGDTGIHTLKDVMNDFNDWLDMTPIAPEAGSSLRPDVLVTVVAQVASIEVPLDTLVNLRAGDILEGPVRTEDFITLKVAGRTIAHGLLLDINGRLVVRIERLV